MRVLALQKTRKKKRVPPAGDLKYSYGQTPCSWGATARVGGNYRIESPPRPAIIVLALSTYSEGDLFHHYLYSKSLRFKVTRGMSSDTY